MSYVVDIHLKLGLPKPRAEIAASSKGVANHMERFLKVYESIQTLLLDDCAGNFMLDVNRRTYLKKMMDVTCLGGKYNRGLTVVEVVDAMTASLSAEVREEALFDACVCGWMIEFMQAHFLVEDDIMDSSITRRGKPCWYRHPGVSTQVAINDGLIVLSWATSMAAHYFGKKSFLLPLLQLFLRTDYRTTIGQLYDVTSMYDSDKLNPDEKMPTTTDYKEFTITHYKRIVRFKTSYYTYHAPLAMGALIAEHFTGEHVDNALMENLAMLMGEYFQIQDDVLDCFADPKDLGKIGTDIQDCKCSWLAVTFLTTADAKQLEVFKAHYGTHNEADIAAIKKLYADTKLQEKFDQFEAHTAEEVARLLAAARGQSATFAAAAQKLWDKTYKRKK